MSVSIYTPEECEKIAEIASLRYVSDATPGIIRKRHGKGFAYYFTNGNKVLDKNILTRIKSLVIPPAYQNVWICLYKNGHIQATARDDKGRKQYLYHPLWTEIRQQQKFNSLIEFGESLQLIRTHIDQQLNKPIQMNKEQMICAIIYLLDNSCIRIGNWIYSKTNKSYGLTTLRKKHLSIEKNKAYLDFNGKNSQVWHVILQDKKIIKILKKCEEIPGYELFKYRDDDNKLRVITSQDVNSYLKYLTNQTFTAKDFRTWTAGRESFYRLVKGVFEASTARAKTLKSVIKEVACLLGHTPSVCQKNYIHPEIIAGWSESTLDQWVAHHKTQIAGMQKDELFLFWLKTKNYEG